MFAYDKVRISVADYVLLTFVYVDVELTFAYVCLRLLTFAYVDVKVRACICLG